MKKIIILLSAFLLTLSLAGCGGEQGISPNGTQEEALEKADPTVALVYYLPTEDAEYIRPVTAEVKKSMHTPKQALTEMISADKKQRYPFLPANLSVKDVSVKDGVALVDFSPELNRLSGSSTVEMLFVNMTVATLTEFPNIRSVRFLMNGDPIQTLSGHFDLTADFKRNPEMIKQ